MTEWQRGGEWKWNDGMQEIFEREGESDGRAACGGHRRRPYGREPAVEESAVRKTRQASRMSGPDPPPLWAIRKPTPDVPQPVVEPVQQPTAPED
jgi:hypothetical protein